MKRIFLSVIILLSFSETVSAQVAFGLEGGLSLANFHTAYPGNSYDNRIYLGISAGALLNIPCSKAISLQAGVYYIPNGSHASWTDATDYYAERVRINSLEIPLTVQYSFFSRKTNHFFAGAGFYYGRNISGTVDEINNVYRISGPLRVGGKEASDDIKAADFGITINGGYQLHSRIFFRLRYQYGLVNESPLSRFGAVIRPYSMALQVGYFFGGRPKPRPMPNGEAAPAAPGGQKNKKIISGSTKS